MRIQSAAFERPALAPNEYASHGVSTPVNGPALYPAWSYRRCSSSSSCALGHTYACAAVTESTRRKAIRQVSACSDIASTHEDCYSGVRRC